MGGEILVRSTPGQGTVFTVRLLLSEAMQEAGSERARHVRGYQGERRRILLVDDDPEHIQLMQRLMQPLDFDVETAGTGSEAHAAALRFQPHLAMLDLSLPDMTGWNVARKLRAEPLLERLRLLIVSANAHEYLPGSEQALHDGFLMKPVDMSRLLSTFRTDDLNGTMCVSRRRPTAGGGTGAAGPHRSPS
jgi:CheY-like chemotaxis protein